jgi:hypothetical protein
MRPLIVTGPIGAVVVPVAGFMIWAAWWCVKELLKH